MTSLPRPFWTEMRAPDFKTDTSEWIAVLPIAAVEQHGPHLPVGVDTYMGNGYVNRVAELLPPDLPVTFLPTQAVGKSNEHISSPGTLTISWDTITRAWLDIGDSVARAGVKKLILITSHGGNVPIMDIVARELRVRHDMLVVATGWSRFGHPAGVYQDFEHTYGIHGGDMETSVMLALHPELIDMEKAEDFHSTQLNLIQEMKYLRVHGQAQFGWKAQDINPKGVCGNAAAASAEKGFQSLDHAAFAFIDLARDVQRFDVKRLWTPE